MMKNGNEDRPLPDGWSWATIGAIGEVITGTTPPKSQRENYGTAVPFVKPGDLDVPGLVKDAKEYLSIIGAEKARVLPPYSVMVTCIGSLGKVGLSGGEVATNQQINSVIPLSSVDARFLYYQCLSSSFQRLLEENASATTVAIINKAKFSKLPVVLAPLAEQERIVAEIEKQFTRLDQAVAALRRLQSHLARYKASVLKAACEGRLVPQDPNDEPAGHLLSRILAERRAQWQAANPGKKYREPQGLDTAGLPELPEGWVWTSWEQLSPRVTVGHVGPMKDQYVEEGIPFLRSQNVRENKYDPEGLKFISPEFDKQIAKSRLKPGDIVVVRSGSVGVTCVIPETLQHANCSDLVIIQKPPYFVSEFGAYYMNSLAKRFVRAGQVGVALVHFNTKSVAALPLPLPPLAEQERIVAEVERRLSVIAASEQAIQTSLARAERLRQSILHRAFTGRLVPQQPEAIPSPSP